MDHGGNPEAGTNPAIGIDSTGLTITSPAGPDSWVVPVSEDFTVAMTWELTGNWANFVAGLGLTYTVTYTFGGIGNPDGPPLTVTQSTVSGQTVYGPPDLTATVPAGSLPVGQYDFLATVSFGGFPPMSAYIEIPVLEVYQG